MVFSFSLRARDFFDFRIVVSVAIVRSFLPPCVCVCVRERERERERWEVCWISFSEKEVPCRSLSEDGRAAAAAAAAPPLLPSSCFRMVMVTMLREGSWEGILHLFPCRGGGWRDCRRVCGGCGVVVGSWQQLEHFPLLLPLPLPLGCRPRSIHHKILKKLLPSLPSRVWTWGFWTFGVVVRVCL